MVTPSEIVASLLGAGAVGSWFWYDKKRTDKRIDDLEKKQTEHNTTLIQIKSTTITESKSREISEEVAKRTQAEVIRTQAEVAETKAMVTTILNQVNTLASNLQTHTAVTKALQEQEKNQQGK